MAADVIIPERGEFIDALIAAAGSRCCGGWPCDSPVDVRRPPAARRPVVQ